MVFRSANGIACVTRKSTDVNETALLPMTTRSVSNQILMSQVKMNRLPRVQITETSTGNVGVATTNNVIDTRKITGQARAPLAAKPIGGKKTSRPPSAEGLSRTRNDGPG